MMKMEFAERKGGRHRPMDAASPITVATPPPPTTPQPRKRHLATNPVHVIADDALPPGLVRGDRVTPFQTRSPLGGTSYDPSPPQVLPLPSMTTSTASTVSQRGGGAHAATATTTTTTAVAGDTATGAADITDGVMDQFDRQIKLSANRAGGGHSPIGGTTTAGSMGRPSIDHVVRAALTNEACRRAVVEDLKKVFVENLAKRGVGIDALSPSTAAVSTMMVGDDKLQQLARSVFGSLPLGTAAAPPSLSGPATATHAAAARSIPSPVVPQPLPSASFQPPAHPHQPSHPPNPSHLNLSATSGNNTNNTTLAASTTTSSSLQQLPMSHHSCSTEANYDREIASLVKMPASHMDPSTGYQIHGGALCAPKPSERLVARDIERLQNDFAGQQPRRRIVRSCQSAFSDATNDTQSEKASHTSGKCVTNAINGTKDRKPQ